jgi:hypothetical protein
MAQDIVWPSSGGGGGGGNNAAAGPTGTPIPTDADFVGFKDASGNLVGVSAATPLPVTLESEVGTLSVNLTQVGGAAVALGQTTQSASIPVTIASNQTAVPASQSGTWTNTVTQTTAANLNATVVQSTAANLNATVVGAGTAGTPTGGVVTVQGSASGTAIPVTSASLPLPTGASTSALQSSTQGTVAPGTAATNSQLVGMVYDSTTSAPTNGQQLALQSDQYGNLQVSAPDMIITGQSAQTATVNNILTATAGTAATPTMGFRYACVQVNSTGTGGTYIFEQSMDNTNFITAPVQIASSQSTSGSIDSATTATASNLIYFSPLPSAYIRLRIATAITGGSIQAISRFSQFPIIPTTLATLTNLNAGSNNVGNVAAIVNTIVPDVASAAVTGSVTSTVFTPAAGSSYVVDIPVTAVSGTTPTLTTQVQESADSGTNWYTVYNFPVITTTGSYTSPMITLTGNRVRYVHGVTGSSPSFTRAINRLQSNQSNYAQPTGTIYVDRSGSTSATPSTSTQVAAYNQQRRYFIVQNLSTSATIYINFTTAAATTGSLQLLPGGSYVMESNTITTEAINVLSTVASVPFAAKEG